MEPVNDALLAGFLAGTLTQDQRTQVVRYLAENSEAREVLRLAYQALHTSDQPAILRAPVRPPMRHARPRVPALARYALLLAVVFSGGAIFRATLSPSTDALRNAEATDGVIRPVLRGDVVRWAAVDNAASYELVLWDPQEARVLARVQTTEPRTSASFAQVLRDLPKNRSVAMRVDAFDLETRLIASSDLTMLDR